MEGLSEGTTARERNCGYLRTAVMILPTTTFSGELGGFAMADDFRDESPVVV